MLLLCRKMQTTLFLILIYKLFICVEADIRPQFILVNTKEVRYVETESYEYVNEKSYNVLPGQPLRIIFDDCYLTSIKCWTHTRSDNIGEFTPHGIRRKTMQRCSYIDIKEVADDWNDIWWCLIKKNTHGNIKTYKIFFEIIVKDAKPDQMILVDNNILHTRKGEKDGEYRAEYYYGEREEVDLVCISENKNNCYVDIYKSNREVFSLRPSFVQRFNLKSEDIRNMVCTCDGSNNYDDKTTLETTFILQDNIEDVLELTINGRAVRGLRERDDNKYYIHIQYAYLNKDFIKVVCKTKTNDYHLSLISNIERLKETATQTNNYVELNITPSNILKIQLSAEHIKLSLYEEIVLTFKQINEYESDTASSIPPRSTVKTGATLTSVITSTTTSTPPSVTRGTPPDHSNINKPMVTHDISKIYTTPSTLTRSTITTGPPLTSISTTTSTLPIPSMTTDGESQEFWWILVLICIIVIVVICISICMYKMKKRFLLVRRELNSNYENLQGHDNSLIPSYPAQWESGSTISKAENSDKPVYVNSATLFSNIATKFQSKGNKRDNVYANNDDIRKRVQEGVYDEATPTYATLETIDVDNKCSNKVPSNIDGRDLYAKVVPKSERNQIIYAEILTNEVNRTMPKNDQPAYSEIRFKIK